MPRHGFVPSARARGSVASCGRMKIKATFYHAGCPVCVTAEQQLASALDPQRYQVESVHLAEQKSRLIEAERAGVRSVPALVLGGSVFHVNHGADLAVLR